MTEQRHEGLRTGLAAVATALVLAAAVVTLTGASLRHPPRIVWWLVGAAMVAYVVYWIASYRVLIRSRRPASGGSAPFRLDEQRDRIAELAGQVTYDQAVFLRELIVSPALYVERITDTAEPSTRVIRRKTSHTVRIPDDFSGKLLAVPIMLQERGAMANNLRLYGSAGERVSSLPQFEAVALMVAMLRKLVALCGRRAIREYHRYIEDDILALLNSNRPMSQTDADAVGEKLILLPHDSSEAMAILLSIRQVIRRLRRYYPILILHETQEKLAGRLLDERIRLVAEFESSPMLQGSTLPRNGRLSWYGRLRDEVRRLLGVRPAVVVLPLTNADRCMSYHVQVKGPDGTYLGRQRIVTTSGAEVDLSAINCSMQPRAAQDSSHLYLRGAEDFSTHLYVNHFYERAPGSIGVAAVSALAATVLVFLGGLVRLGYSPGTSSDLLAAILAFPAVAGALVGLDRGSGLVGGTLTARASTIVTMAVSLLASGLYVLGPITTFDKGGAPFLSRAGSLLWASLMAIAVLNLLVSVSSWILRASVESHFTRRAVTREAN